jgi:hypothetical protein
VRAGVAFAQVCVALPTGDDDDVIQTIANKIIELAKTGDLNPDVSEPRKVRSPQECSAGPTLVGAFRTKQRGDTYVTRRSN